MHDDNSHTCHTIEDKREPKLWVKPRKGENWVQESPQMQRNLFCNFIVLKLLPRITEKQNNNYPDKMPSISRVNWSDIMKMKMLLGLASRWHL